jgi:hypothetical protein
VYARVDADSRHTKMHRDARRRNALARGSFLPSVRLTNSPPLVLFAGNHVEPGDKGHRHAEHGEKRKVLMCLQRDLQGDCLVS